MKNYLSKKTKTLFVFSASVIAVVAVFFTMVACKEKATAPEPREPEPCLCPEDYEKLWEQPLETIQNCVIGKWKILNAWESRQNSFITITKDSVFVTANYPDPPAGKGNYWLPFTESGYKFVFRKVWLVPFASDDGYVMNLDATYHPHPVYPDELPGGYDGWWFRSIQNDTLVGWINPWTTWQFQPRIVLLRITEGAEK